MARHLITSALPYINGVKHLGNLVGSMLPADTYARYLRLAGHEVLLICATDEHGTPAELAAAQQGMAVEDFCALNHDIQGKLGERFRLDWDYFGRTSAPSNHELTQYFAERLAANGYIEERVTQQLYSLDDERFLPDRYVSGTCPNCGYTNARGDQCENCTKTLDPTDLIDPRSSISGSTRLEIRESRHLFILQSALAEDLRRWIDTKIGTWPTIATSIALKWLNEGLQDRGITRDLKWGVPVNRPGFEDKVFYVWFDAPIGYIAATKDWADLDPQHRSWESWWKTDEGAHDVTYTQFMAKDNIPFHTLSFPATLLGANDHWKLVDELKGFNWLTYYGGKFSTSEGRGVFMGDALDVYAADGWRWYLMSNAPESDDSSFTWEQFGESVNKELVATLGNFVNRSTSQIARHFGEVVPEGGAPGEDEAQLRLKLAQHLDNYVAHMNGREFRKATSTLRAMWAEGNLYLEIREPWRAIKSDRDDAALTLRTCIAMMRLFGHLSRPFIPDTAEVLDTVVPSAPILQGVDASTIAAAFEVAGGATYQSPPMLFSKIADEQLQEWAHRFGAPTSN